MNGIEFPADNKSYLRWTATHPDGWVINIERSLNTSDARLHRASCRWINGTPPRGDGFIGSYIKVCSESLAELDAWVRERLRSEIRPCGTCRPATLGTTVLSVTAPVVPTRAPRDEEPRPAASTTGDVRAAAADR